MCQCFFKRYTLSITYWSNKNAWWDAVLLHKASINRTAAHIIPIPQDQKSNLIHVCPDVNVLFMNLLSSVTLQFCKNVGFRGRLIIENQVRYQQSSLDSQRQLVIPNPCDTVQNSLLKHSIGWRALVKGISSFVRNSNFYLNIRDAPRQRPCISTRVSLFPQYQNHHQNQIRALCRLEINIFVWD